MGRIIPSSAAVGLLLLAIAHAQDAPAPARAGVKPSASPGGKASAVTGEERTPSRYHLSDIENHIAAIASRFAISGLEADPFGLTQDPSKRPATPRIIHATPKLRQNIPPIPFKDVVGAIQVTAVMPSQRRFLVGSRSIRRGDRLPLLYRDKSLSVEVVRVASASITFRNVKTKEVAKLVISSVPSGMTRDGGREAGPPGLERSNPRAPLQLDVPSALPTSAPAPNRR